MGTGRRLLFLLILLGAILRLAYTWEMMQLPTARHPVMDARQYDTVARSLAAGHWIPEEPFYQSPLYPYILASFYAFVSPSRVPPRLFQVLLASLTVVLIAASSNRLHGPRAALFAAALAALYGPFVFYTPRLIKTTWHLFALALFLHRSVLAKTRGKTRDYVLAGCFLGLASLLRENVLLILPFFLVWLFLSPPDQGRKIFRQSVQSSTLFLAGALLALAPAALLNAAAGGQPLPFSGNSGVNFYVGNHRGATGTYAPLFGANQDPETERANARILAAKLKGPPPLDPESLTTFEVSRIFLQQGLAEIAAEPGTWLRLMAHKTALFWQGYELPDAEDFYVYRRLAPSLWLAPVTFLAVGPLGLLGLACLWRKRISGSSYLVTMAAAVFLSVVLVFVFGRYRLSVVVFLLLPAAYCLDRIVEAWQLRRFGTVGRWLAALMATGVVLNLSYDRDTQRAVERSSYFNLAAASLAEASEQRDRSVGPDEISPGLEASISALHYVEEALSRNPSWPAAQLQKSSILHRLGIYRYEEGDLLGALARFREAKAHLPDLSETVPELRPEVGTVAAGINRSLALAAANGGAELLNQGRLQEARGLFLESLELQPDSFEAHLNLGICELQTAREASLDPSRQRALERSRVTLRKALDLARNAGEENRVRALLEHLQGLEESPDSDPYQPFSPSEKTP